MGGVASVTGDVKGKGNELFKAGKYGEAFDAYTLALDADPKDHTVYSNRSAARMKCVGGAGRWGGVVCGVVWGAHMPAHIRAQRRWRRAAHAARRVCVRVWTRCAVLT